ncbi:hypothetical protein BH11BAC6_BH11BAC6_16890 [soil metagenome]
MHVVKIILILFLVITFTSCQRKYIRTDKTCVKNCFLEVYERSQLGVSYLTEYQYECKGDTLMIFKYSKDYFGGTGGVVQTKTYSLSQLKKERKFEN